jgi:IS30 family transposase
MSQYQDTTREKKFQHLNYEERKIIERMLKEKAKQADIARLLRRNRSTISREIVRGSVKQKKQVNSISKKITIPLETTYSKYFAETGEKRYNEHRQNCGAKCSILNHIELVKFVEDKVLSKQKWSPDAATGYARTNHIFENIVSTKTFYNWIDAGITKIKNIDLILKVKRKARSEIKVRKKILGKSIDERPKEIENREEFGHWEGDGIVGKDHNGQLITLVERKIGIGLILNVGDKKEDKIVQVLDSLQVQYGRYFSTIFKTITFDNGSEFSNSTEMERENRTKVYYAHPYSSWERATNENWNGIVRRFIPKGSSFENLSFEQLERINMWINTLPRKRFGYKTPQDLFEEEIHAIMTA